MKRCFACFILLLILGIQIPSSVMIYSFIDAVTYFASLVIQQFGIIFFFNIATVTISPTFKENYFFCTLNYQNVEQLSQIFIFSAFNAGSSAQHRLCILLHIVTFKAIPDLYLIPLIISLQRDKRSGYKNIPALLFAPPVHCCQVCFSFLYILFVSSKRLDI